MKRFAVLLAFMILIAVLATGAYATTPSGVVVSGQVYYCWADWWGPAWGDLFPYSYHVESDPGDWLYGVQPPMSYYYEGQVQFGTNVSHSGPRTVGAYDGYCFSTLSSGISEFDFDFFAVVDQSQYPFPVDHWGSSLLRLELWKITAWSGPDNVYCRSDSLLWSSTGPWSIEPHHAHVTLSEPYGIGAYAFRLTTVPEPPSFSGLSLPLIGSCGWWLWLRRSTSRFERRIGLLFGYGRRR